MEVLNHRRAAPFPAIVFLVLILIIVNFSGTALATGMPGSGQGGHQCRVPAGPNCAIAACQIDCRSACWTARVPSVDYYNEEQSALPPGKLSRLLVVSVASGLALFDTGSTPQDIAFGLFRPPRSI